MLQIDRAASCMLAPLRLTDFLARRLRLRDERDLRLENGGTIDGGFDVVGGQEARVGGLRIETISAKLTEGNRRLRVMSAHKVDARNNAIMSYTVRGLDNVRCDEAYFPEACGSRGGWEGVMCPACAAAVADGGRANSDNCERPYRTTVAAWFEREFPQYLPSGKMRRPDLPCLLCGPEKAKRKLLLPLELASILPGQPQQELGPDLLSEMIRETCIWPATRVPLIESVVRDEYSTEAREREHTRASEAFGMRIEPRLVETNARVLEPCRMLYANQKLNVATNGSWNLRETAFQRGGECAGIAVVYCVPKQPHFELRAFIDNLQRVARERAMPLASARFVGEIEAAGAVDAHRLEPFLSERVEALARRERCQIDLIIAVLTDTAGESPSLRQPERDQLRECRRDRVGTAIV